MSLKYFENLSMPLSQGCCWHSGIPHQSPAQWDFEKYFDAPQPGSLLALGL